ncbi:MAG: hypothetical protein ABIT71_03985 [Vicinamibacteraceae bacterium]
MDVLLLDANGVKRWRLPGLGQFQGVVDDTVIVSTAGRLSRVEDVGVVPLSEIEARLLTPRLNGVADVPPGWTAERLALNPQRLNRSLSVGGRVFNVALDFEGDVERLRLLSEGEVLANLVVVRGVRRLDRATYDRLFER